MDTKAGFLVVLAKENWVPSTPNTIMKKGTMDNVDTRLKAFGNPLWVGLYIIHETWDFCQIRPDEGLKICDKV